MEKYFALIALLFLAVPFTLIAQDPEVPVEPALNIWTIVSGALAVLAAIFGTAFNKVKTKIKEVVHFGQKAMNVVVVGSEALDDNSVDPTEVKALKAAIAAMKLAWEAIWDKK